MEAKKFEPIHHILRVTTVFPLREPQKGAKNRPFWGYFGFLAILPKIRLWPNFAAIDCCLAVDFGQNSSKKTNLNFFHWSLLFVLFCGWQPKSSQPGSCDDFGCQLGAGL